MNRLRNEGIFWILIFIGSICRIFAVIHNNPIGALFSDPATQWGYALAPLNSSPLAAMDPIFYPIWLSAIARLTLGLAVPVACYASALSLFTPWCWYLFMKESLPSRSWALAGYVLLTWLPSWIGIYSYFMIETLLLPLIGLALWLTWRYFRIETFTAYVYVVIAWIIACLTKLSAAPMACLLSGYIILHSRDKFKKASFLCIVLLAVTIPLGYRSLQLIRVWAPFGYPMHNRIYLRSNNAAIQLHLSKKDGPKWWFEFGSSSVYAYPFGPFFKWKSNRVGICVVNVDLDSGSRDWNAALNATQTSLRSRISHFIENLIYFLWGPSWPDNNVNHGWERMTTLSRWIWFPLLLVVVLGNIQVFRLRLKLDLIPLLTMFCWLLAMTLPVVPTEGRYRKPFEGLLIVNLLWLIPALLEIYPLRRFLKANSKV
jgi:hypothetical protein